MSSYRSGSEVGSVILQQATEDIYDQGPSPWITFASLSPPHPGPRESLAEWAGSNNYIPAIVIGERDCGKLGAISILSL